MRREVKVFDNMDMDGNDASTSAVQKQAEVRINNTMDTDPSSIIRSPIAGDDGSKMLLDGNRDDKDELVHQGDEKDKEENEDISGSNIEEPKKKTESAKSTTDEEDGGDHVFDESANEETRLQLLSASIRDQDELERMVGRQVCSRL